MAENTNANGAQERVLMKGNEVLAEAAMRAGCRFFFGYPITPQTELAAYMAKKLPTSCRPSPRSRPSTWCTVRPPQVRAS